MMCFIDDDQIEVRGRIQIGQSVGFSFFTFFTLINSAIQNRVRNNCLVISNRPFSVPIRIRNDLTKLLSRNGNEFLIKTLHFIFPFTFRYKRLGANDKYIFKLVTSLQLFDNQACFNRFTDTNAIRNQNARFVRLDKLQCRSELIRHKINSCGIQRIKITGRGIVDLICRQITLQCSQVNPIIVRAFLNQCNLSRIEGLGFAVYKNLVFFDFAKICD